MPDADDPHPREVEVVRLAPCPVAPLALPPARPLVPLPPLSTIPPHSRVDEPVHRCSSTTSSYHAHHTQFTTHATHTHTHTHTPPYRLAILFTFVILESSTVRLSAPSASLNPQSAYRSFYRLRTGIQRFTSSVLGIRP